MPFDRNPKLGSQFPISIELVRQSGLDHYFLIRMEGRGRERMTYRKERERREERVDYPLIEPNHAKVFAK